MFWSVKHILIHEMEFILDLCLLEDELVVYAHVARLEPIKGVKYAYYFQNIFLTEPSANIDGPSKGESWSPVSRGVKCDQS